jgi:hypothetical protein
VAAPYFRRTPLAGGLAHPRNVLSSKEQKRVKEANQKYDSNDDFFLQREPKELTLLPSIVQLIVPCKPKNLADEEKSAETEGPPSQAAPNYAGNREEYNANNEAKHPENAQVIRRNEPRNVAFVANLRLTLKAPLKQSNLKAENKARRSPKILYVWVDHCPRVYRISQAPRSSNLVP